MQVGNARHADNPENQLDPTVVSRAGAVRVVDIGAFPPALSRKLRGHIVASDLPMQLCRGGRPVWSKHSREFTVETMQAQGVGSD